MGEGRSHRGRDLGGVRRRDTTGSDGLAAVGEGLANRLHLHLFCGKELRSAAVPLPQPLARRIGWSFVEATAVVIECVRLKASSPIPLFDGGAADTEFAGELGAGE